MKNRNVHSLCLVPRQDYSSPSPPASESALLSSECTEHLNFNSTSVVCPQTTSHTPSPQKPPADSLSYLLRSKPAIIKAGVITPITPDFSPSACSLLEDGQCQRHLASEPEVNGKQMMPVQNKASFFGDFNTPNSLDEEELLWQENGAPPQMQQSLSRFERRTYASLSNLPTPPPSDSPVSPVLFLELSGEELRNPDLLGPASYLASLVPTCASARPASIPLLELILYRFSLRIEGIALAGIILDTLSSQFVRKWRTELSHLALWDLWGDGMGELLALAALGIAAKWIEDRGISLTAGAMSDMSDGRFGRREISVTERLMLAELGWGLMELSSEGDVQWAMEEMARWRARVGGITAGQDLRGINC